MLLHNVDIGAPQVILLLSYFTHTGASSSNYATIGAFGAVDRIADELARIEAAKAMDAPVDQSDIYRRPDYSGALETLLVALKGRGSFGVGGRSVGSADFFASLVPQDKQEQELRSWTVRDPASVHVVEEHNHALKWHTCSAWISRKVRKCISWSCYSWVQAWRRLGVLATPCSSRVTIAKA